MSIIKDIFITDSSVELYRTYSNEGYKIQQIETGYIYDDAIDVTNDVEYIETSEKIEVTK